MDINKINNRVDGSNFNKTDAASKGKEASETARSSSSVDTPRDKVSLSDYAFRNNEQLFARLELEKLNESSSGKLQEINVEITEYQEASESSSEAAQETKMGQKINDPSVWGDIADKILQ